MRSALLAVGAEEGSLIVDPWNGSGTTTDVSACLGARAQGFDINPAMVVIAKSRNLCARELVRIEAVSDVIAKSAVKLQSDVTARTVDPLAKWLCPNSVTYVRALELAIREQFYAAAQNNFMSWNASDVTKLPAAAAFLYTALFSAVKSLLAEFRPTNPTWLRTPTLSHRKRPAVETIRARFGRSIRELAQKRRDTQSSFGRKQPEVQISVAHSQSLPLSDRTVDVVITSPPYCTRIDYAVATRAELAVLGIGDNEFRVLREAMIGAPVVARGWIAPKATWGRHCLQILDAIRSHRAKASEKYYFRTYAQYFDGLFRSLAEIDRVCGKRAQIVIVVQDNYYKEVHVDLPQVVEDMGSYFNWDLMESSYFRKPHTMAAVNSRRMIYRRAASANECVLRFQK